MLPDGTPSSRKQAFPPIGLAYLAATVRREGYEVHIIDMLVEEYGSETFETETRFLRYGMSTDKLLARMDDIKPDVVGVSIMFSQKLPVAFEICASIKQRYPDLPIVLGGPHPSGAPLETMQNNNIDFVMAREADESFPQLLNHLNDQIPRNEVPNLYYRDGGEIKNTCPTGKAVAKGAEWEHYLKKDAGIPVDLDGLPYPAWDLLPMDAYYETDVRLAGADVVRKRYGMMVATRGCPYTCSYCAAPLMSGFRAFRFRDVECVVQEIRWLIDEFGVEEIMFNDDNFFASRAKAKVLIKRLGAEFPDLLFSNPGGTEVNKVDRELIDIMAANNFYRINFAIETGDQELQNALIDKKVKLHRVPDLIEYSRASGIETRAMYMIGFPGETRAQMQKTVDIAKTLDVDDFYISIVTPVRGTELFDQVVNDDLLLEEYDYNDIAFSSGKLKLPDTTPEELEKIRRDVWKEAFEKRRSKVDRLAKTLDNKIQVRDKKFSDVNEYETVGYVTLDSIPKLVNTPSENVNR